MSDNNVQELYGGLVISGFAFFLDMLLVCLGGLYIKSIVSDRTTGMWRIRKLAAKEAADAMSSWDKWALWGELVTFKLKASLVGCHVNE
jgi:hypothetical protein